MKKALSKPKPKIRINKKKLEEIRKHFNELRHKFSKIEIDKYRKAFYDIKNYRYLSASETETAKKNLNELKKRLRLKRFHGNVDSVDYDFLDSYDDDDYADDDEYRRIGSITRLFFDRDYYKLIRAYDSFGKRRNNYFSPEEYLGMIRPFLRDLINYHKSKTKLTNRASNNDSERGE